MELYLLVLAYFNRLDKIINHAHSSQKLAFVVVRCVLYDASSKLNAVYELFLHIKRPKLESVDLFDDLVSKFHDLPHRKLGFVSEQAVGSATKGF